VTKRYATKVEIVGLCMSINTPTAPFALRLSAQLMLGVARVFARKSDIVLGDSNALLHALQKFSSAPLGTDGSARGGRGRIQGSITLGDADPNAFNKITLPAKRSGSKRKRTTGDDDTEEELSSQGNTKGVTSLAVALQGDPSAIDLPALTPWMDSQFQFDFDVDAAMEMAFPSISMPASGKRSKGVGPESNGVYDGSNGHLSSSGKKSGSKSTYRARTEDITIAQEPNRLSNSDLMISSAVDTGMMNYSMLVDHDRLDASHGGSHGGNGSSNNYMMEWPHGPQVDDLLPNYNVFGLSKFAKSTEKAGDGVKRVSDSGDAGSGAVGTPTFLPRDVKEYGNFTSQRATKTGQGACPRSGDFAALGRISPGTPVQDIADVEGELRAASRDVKRSSGARPPRAPKRFLKMQFDEVTELSTSQIRDNLNDVARTLGGRATTETSTTPKKRRVGPSRSVIEEAMVSNPLMGYMMASQLKAVWEQLVAGPELDAMRRRRQAEKEHNDRQSTPQRDDTTKSDTQSGQNRSVLATPLPQGHTPLHQDASYAPIFADTPEIGATGMVNSDTPDFAAFRDEGPVTGDPSTAPQPANVDMTALEPEKLRDQVLDNVRRRKAQLHFHPPRISPQRTPLRESNSRAPCTRCLQNALHFTPLQITEADRAAYEVARRLTFDGNDPEGHGRFANSSLEQNVKTNTPAL
jgi:N terminus of Rad21 / Rec8 like protein